MVGGVGGLGGRFALGGVRGVGVGGGLCLCVCVFVSFVVVFLCLVFFCFCRVCVGRPGGAGLLCVCVVVWVVWCVLVGGGAAVTDEKLPVESVRAVLQRVRELCAL